MTSNNAWFPYSVPRPNARVRLFCFPYAGGGARIYRGWVDRAPAVIEVVPVQLPGRFNRIREAGYTDVKELVRRIVADLAGSWDKPFAFFGHSMGALIAFELARALVQGGERPPLRLFLSARRAPQLPDAREPMHQLPEAEFIKAIIRLKGTPREVLEHPELMQLAIPVLRADFQLCETYSYVPGPPLEIPITTFAALGDEDCLPEVVAPWRELSTGACQAHTVDGDHFFLHPQEELIAGKVFDALTRDLGAMQQRSAAPAEERMAVKSGAQP